MKIFFLLILSVCLFSCATIDYANLNSDLKQACNETISYDRITFHGTVCHIVKIKLDSPELEITAYPDHKESSGNRFTSKRTSSFANESASLVAINCNPFDKDENYRTIIGSFTFKGVEFSKANEKYACLLLKKNSTGFSPSIVPQNEAEGDYVFGGYYIILKNDFIYEFKNIKNSRSCCGISPESNTLYLMACDRNIFSKGLSYMECAEIFKELGCTIAMELDGGSSTEMVINGKTVTSALITVSQASSFGFKILK